MEVIKIGQTEKLGWVVFTFCPQNLQDSTVPHIDLRSHRKKTPFFTEKDFFSPRKTNFSPQKS